MPRDVENEERLVELVDGLATKVAGQLRKHGLTGKTVRLKLRLADFQTFTRQATLPAPTDDAETITTVARELLRREVGPGRAFRLVGVGVTIGRPVLQLALLPQTEGQGATTQ